MSDYIEEKGILLVGAGAMAQEYAKVLKAMGREFTVVGRSKKSAEAFEKAIGKMVVVGGIEDYLEQLLGKNRYRYAIVAVNLHSLYDVAMGLKRAGIRRILLEKPGCIQKDQIENLYYAEGNAEIYIAYNRRFYASVEKAKEIILADGGVKSIQFEFTEWSHVIDKTTHPDDIKQKWFLMNSTHVLDTTFYLAGKPKKMECFKGGECSWHKAGTIFAGAGVTETGAMFSYQANWCAPGRWSIEALTDKHRLIFKPLEKLQVQNIGSVAVEPIEIDDKIDTDYKAGVYREVQAFLDEQGEKNKLCTLKEQMELLPLYEKISGEKY